MIMLEYVIMKIQFFGGIVFVYILFVYYIYGQYLFNQVFLSGFLGCFELEFQRINNNSFGSSGVNVVGNIERWFGNDGC